MSRAGHFALKSRPMPVAVAMTRYRLDHGSYPEKLDLLVPDYLDEIPQIRLTGSRFRMVRDGD